METSELPAQGDCKEHFQIQKEDDNDDPGDRRLYFSGAGRIRYK